MIYLKIFFCYLQIGLFSIGGGHASIPLIRSMIVDDRTWLSVTEFVDMITISEMTPGPFAINSATFVGIKMGGPFGGVLATFACMLPSFIITMLLCTLYRKYRSGSFFSGLLYGIRPTVSGLIASAGLLLIFMAFFGTSDLTAIKSVDILAVIIAISTFIILRKTKINSVLMIVISGTIGAGIFALYDYIVLKLA